jgi:hypothetical protein
MPLRRVIPLCASAVTAGCLFAPPPNLPAEPAVTPPVIIDQPGITVPRLGNQINVVRGDSIPQVMFSIPVSDDNLGDRLQFQFYVNSDRDCVGDRSRCAPVDFGDREPNGMRQRTITRTLSFSTLGCNRVELWVSSRFTTGDNFRTPARPDDFDFATWWVYVKAAPGAGGPTSDAGAEDPAENCANLVPP